MANSFQKDSKPASKLYIRVANQQRISTGMVFFPSVFTIDGHEFSGLQFRVLPRLKGSNIIMGLPSLKIVNMVIQPNLTYFTIEDFTIHCEREPRRISSQLVDYGKMTQIIIKHARNKKNLKDVFLISLNFAK